MAYNGRYTSIKRVIESVFRDSGIDNVDWESAVEWTANFMGLVGIPYQYITVSTNGKDNNPDFIKINNFRGKLPNTIVNIISCRKVDLNNDEIINSNEMIESTDLYQDFNNINQPNINIINPTITVTESEIDKYGDITSENVKYDYKSNKVKNKGIYNYKIQREYIFTDFKDGYIELIYKSYPVDKLGFPMIPDDEKYITALKYFIIYKLDWKKWRANPASPGLKAMLNDSEQKSDFYIGAARTKAHIPTIDKMESLKNMWLRSIPKPNEHSTGFRDLNKQEQRYNNFPPKRYR